MLWCISHRHYRYNPITTNPSLMRVLWLTPHHFSSITQYSTTFLAIPTADGLNNPESSSASGLEEGEVELSKRGIGNRKRAASPQKKDTSVAGVCDVLYDIKHSICISWPWVTLSGSIISILLHSTLISALLCSFLLCSALLFSSLLCSYSALLCSSHLFSFVLLLCFYVFCILQRAILRNLSFRTKPSSSPSEKLSLRENPCTFSSGTYAHPFGYDMRYRWIAL